MAVVLAVVCAFVVIGDGGWGWLWSGQGDRDGRSGEGVQRGRNEIT